MILPKLAQLPHVMLYYLSFIITGGPPFWEVILFLYPGGPSDSIGPRGPLYQVFVPGCPPVPGGPPVLTMQGEHPLPGQSKPCLNSEWSLRHCSLFPNQQLALQLEAQQAHVHAGPDGRLLGSLRRVPGVQGIPNVLLCPRRKSQKEEKIKHHKEKNSTSFFFIF